MFRLLMSVALLVVSAAAHPAATAVVEEDIVLNGDHGHCVHAAPLARDMPARVALETHHRLVKRSLDHQMRIKVFYHESVEKLASWKRDVVKKVVPSSVSYWESVLKIRRNLATIHMNRKCEDNQFFIGFDDPTHYCKNQCVETKCGEFVVPKEHLGTCHTCNSVGRDCKKAEDAGAGVEDADFILYVSAIPTKQCGEVIGRDASTVAYAAHCQQEEAFDRPVAGHTNICPAAVKSEGEEDTAALESTIKHELLHALGFSSSLFAFYRDADGKPRTPRDDEGNPPINNRLGIRQWDDNTIKTIERPWMVNRGNVTRKVRVMVTPRVVEEVRAHFGCPTLEGAELEDQGGDGTALTHWEKRVFQNEAMTGTVHTKNPVYSRLTFALLEDTGWYLPNYDLADRLVWGRGLGCAFAQESCMTLMKRNAEEKSALYPFCSTLMEGSSRTHCTADGSSVGSCNLVRYARDLPNVYQNFADGEVGGVDDRDVRRVGSSVALADFCPFVQEFTWKSGGEKSRGTMCAKTANAPDEEGNFALETYGNGTKCVEQGGKWNQTSCGASKQWQRYGAGCYRYECKEGRVHIQMRNVSLACDAEGEHIDVSLIVDDWLHSGSLTCPKCSDFCDDCSATGKRVDPASLREKLDNKKCLSLGFNILGSFLQDFGINVAG